MADNETTLAVLEEIRSTSIHDLAHDELPESMRRVLQKFKDELAGDGEVCFFQSAPSARRK